MVFGHIHWVFTVHFKQLLCSLAHAAALKHSFLCDMTLGYTKAIHPSAAIFILESVVQNCMEWPEWFYPDFLLVRDGA